MRTINAVCLIGFIALATSFISGCATIEFTQDREKVKGLQKVAVVVDASMSHGRSFKLDTMSLAENEEIARKIASRAMAILGEKGYAVADRAVHTVGISGMNKKEVEVVNDIGAKHITSPPFLVLPDGSMETSVAANLYQMVDEEDLNVGENPFGTTPVLVINADGRYISIGAIAGNVGKVPLNIIASVGIVLGGAVSRHIWFWGLDRDIIHLTFRLFDPSTKTLLWKDEYRVPDNPDSETFLKYLEKMMENLPQMERSMMGRS